jgi:hypothetical protein
MPVYRQGDVALIRIGDAPASSPPVPARLASGEDSGHWHEIAGVIAGDLVTVPEPAQLRCQPAAQEWRHEPIDVPPGQYRVVIQREYTPAGMRRVED